MIGPIPAREVSWGSTSSTRIENGVSIPANPATHSFLTLPPELRNAVYEIVYEESDPIMYNNRWRREWTQYNERFSDKYDTSGFVRNRKPSSRTSFLLTCRRVYHEAVGIFYSRNKFLISVPEDRKHHTTNQIGGAVFFLRAIGSQFPLLRRLEINVDLLFPINSWVLEPVDVLPIVRVLWLNPTIVGRVLFSHTGCTPDLNRPNRVRRTTPANATSMNRILEQMAIVDDLELKRYGRFERLILYIWIEQDLSSGSVVFYPFKQLQSPIAYPTEGHASKNWGQGRHVDFMVHSNQRLSWALSMPTSQLCYETLAIRDKILDYALTSPHGVLFDVDDMTTQNFNHALLKVNQSIRRYTRSNTIKLNQITIRMKTEHMRSSFSQFKNFREWSFSPISRLCRRDKHDLHVKHAPIFLLEFNVPATNLSEIRVNIEWLIECEAFAIICFRLANSQDGGQHPIEHNIYLETLRRKCFILLSLCLLHDRRIKRKNSLAQLWFDGRGNAIEAILPATGAFPEVRIVNEYRSIDDEEVEKVGNNLITRILKDKDVNWRWEGEKDRSPCHTYLSWAHLMRTDWRHGWNPRGDFLIDGLG